MAMALPTGQSSSISPAHEEIRCWATEQGGGVEACPICQAWRRVCREGANRSLDKKEPQAQEAKGPGCNERRGVTRHVRACLHAMRAFERSSACARMCMCDST